MRAIASVLLLVAICAYFAHAEAQGKREKFGAPVRPDQPPFPIWPDTFVADYDVLVPSYGPNFRYKGSIHYDYRITRMRAYYDDWCIPLFDDAATPEKLSFKMKRQLRGPSAHPGMYNHSCSFLMTEKGTYFISPDFPFTPNRCCKFDAQIGPPTPDWVTNTQWNGTDTLRGSKCNVWWFPGTDDPSHPYYGYWSKIDEKNTPVRFLGLSSIGVTILDYTSYLIRPPSIGQFEIPDNCQRECESPPAKFRGF